MSHIAFIAVYRKGDVLRGIKGFKDFKDFKDFNDLKDLSVFCEGRVLPHRGELVGATAILFLPLGPGRCAGGRPGRS